MHSSFKRKALYVFLIAFALSAILTFLFSYEIADALLPISYVDKVQNQELDWWSDVIGIDVLKAAVEDWKQDDSFDFKYLEDNPVVIAVIDSGVNLEHELFSGKYNDGGLTDNEAVDNNGTGKYDVILRRSDGTPIVKNTAVSHNPSIYTENDVSDDENRRHGTHVAGIVATLIHVLNIERYIKILPIKASYHVAFTGEDKFSGADVKSAVDFALQQGADVINMSLSSDARTFAGFDQSTTHTKAVLVAAAGNDGSEVKRYPAALPNVIGVMNYKNVNGEAVLSNTSNYGFWNTYGYDLCALGADIYSANGVIGDSGFDYKALSGTSMATPIVSFGAALLAMKYKALAGNNGEEMDSVELARLVKKASTKVLNKTEGGKTVGDCRIFDLNALIGYTMCDAKIETADVSLLKQRLGALKAIPLKLSVVPLSHYGQGKVEWFAGEDKFAEGFEASYMPKPVVGDTEIRAVWRHSCDEHGEEAVKEASVGISVGYMLVTAENVSSFEISASLNGNPLKDLSGCEVGKTYKLTVDSLNYIPKEDADNCLWFVNGVYNHKGNSFDFTPTQKGTYEIEIKVNGFEGKAARFIVGGRQADYARTYELKIFTIVVGVIVSVFAIAVAAVVIYRHKQRKNTSQE